jgi:hypothetical protein
MSEGVRMLETYRGETEERAEKVKNPKIPQPYALERESEGWVESVVSE